MEQWPKHSILLSQTEAERRNHHHRPVRVLGDTSGNVQSYAQDFKPGLENQVSIHDIPGLRVPGSNNGQYHFPLVPTLPSNDQKDANLARLHARHRRREPNHRFQRRFDDDRPYLKCLKYTEYRQRRRQDTGEDGKPVWDDPMEEAFQNALVAIKPMGRKKKSQNGKPNGRNELIAEWIFHETGQTRTRKQVSSHIQVLNQLLKGIPEWDSLVAVLPDDGTNSGNMEYFGNSIERTVNSRRHFRQHGLGNHNHQYEASGYGSYDKHQVAKLSFHMWVSRPEKVEESLHNYTSLQSSLSIAEPTMLESIKNWRRIYPRLEEIINDWTPSQRCDVIMLDASFQLMTEFPPKGSKLGISLELDFLDPLKSNYKALDELHVWEGRTTIYNRGVRVQEPAWYNDCHSGSTGKVKLFLESKFWATTFTELTERRQRAEDAKNEAAIEAANEWSRSYLRHLTVVQEVYAGETRSHLVPRKRMAILLWKFSQAQAHWAVGITTWQRLIPPPDRMTTNSPPPTQEMALPPLAMDTVIDMAGNAPSFDLNYDFMSHFDPYQTYASFGHDFDEELCQDGNMMSKHSPATKNRLAAVQASFAMDPTQDTSAQDLHNLHVYHFDLPLHDSQYLGHHEEHAASGNLFETQQNHHETQANQGSQNQQNINVHVDDVQGSMSQHPLNRFDINTHKMLQAQLGHDHEDDESKANGIDDEALRQALVTASAMSDLGNQQNDFDHQQGVESNPQQSWTAPPTPLTRPPLQTHASFAGQSSHAQSQPHHYGALQEIPHNMAGFNANRIIATNSAHSSSHPMPATTQEEQFQSTGNTQTLGPIHLEDSESQSQYGGLGESFVDVKDEVQSQMGGSFVVVGREDREQTDSET